MQKGPPSPDDQGEHTLGEFKILTYKTEYLFRGEDRAIREGFKEEAAFAIRTKTEGQLQTDTGEKKLKRNNTGSVPPSQKSSGSVEA